MTPPLLGVRLHRTRIDVRQRVERLDAAGPEDDELVAEPEVDGAASVIRRLRDGEAVSNDCATSGTPRPRSLRKCAILLQKCN